MRITLTPSPSTPFILHCVFVCNLFLAATVFAQSAQQAGAPTAVVRRDPSGIVQKDGKYYVWYSRSVGPSAGFGGDVERDKVWPYKGGIASLITTDGPERNTIQWAPDGINFEIMSHIQSAPHAIGLNRTADHEKEPTEILRWGLTHQYKTGDYQYIRRFSSRRVRSHVAKGEADRH